jgi:hypothetical protein
MEKFLRFMNERFPASQGNGVPWFECIDTSKFDERDTALCIFSQLSSSVYWPHALAVLQIPDRNVVLKHIGTMLYNTSDKAINRGWDKREAARLNRAFIELIDRLQEENQSETRAFALRLVHGAAARAE